MQQAAVGAEKQAAGFDQPGCLLPGCPAALARKSSISFAGCAAGEWWYPGKSGVAR